MERMPDIPKTALFDNGIGTTHTPRPAFLHRSSAIWFLLLLVVLLLSPVISNKAGLSNRSAAYRSMPMNLGDYTFIRQQIFEEKEDIDVLFLGASVIWSAIDTPRVQKELSRELGRPANVVTLGFLFNGIDVPYVILKDLLANRKVRTVVFSVPRDDWTIGPSIPGCKLQRYPDFPDVVEELPLDSKLSLYACSVLATPHDLLAAIRSPCEKRSEFKDSLGAKKEVLGMDRDPETFVRFRPSPPEFTADSLIYSDKTKENFSFKDQRLPEYQELYLDALVELLKQHDVNLVFLNVPQFFERESEKVIEYQNWQARFGPGVTLIGVPPRKLFAGLDEHSTELLHCDIDHFNGNGNEFFTEAIMPAILEAVRYEKTNP